MKAAHSMTFRFAAALALMFSAANARAHSIVVHSGTVQWEGGTLCIQLDADGHVLQHEIKALRAQLSETQMLMRLANSIMVVGHESGPISIDRIESISSSAGVKCFYNVPQSVSAVALTHQSDQRELAPLARQIQLGLKDKDGTIARHLRLTSRGNHAVVLRGQMINGPTGVDPFVEPVMQVNRSTDGRSLQIDYPCRLLATWSEMRTFDKPTISLAEFDALRPALSKWAEANVSVSMPQTGTETKPGKSAGRISLIDPQGREIEAGTVEQIATVTSRVRYTLELPTVEAANPMTINWRGFNAAINRMIVLQNTPSKIELRGFLTPHEATAVIPKDQSAPVAIRRAAVE